MVGYMALRTHKGCPLHHRDPWVTVIPEHLAQRKVLLQRGNPRASHPGAAGKDQAWGWVPENLPWALFILHFLRISCGWLVWFQMEERSWCIEWSF